MNSLNRLACGIAFTVALVVAAPAVASGTGNHDSIVAVSVPANPGASPSACGSSLAPLRCGQEQSRLLAAVAKMARQEKPDASQRDISRRQLNALIASVN